MERVSKNPTKTRSGPDFLKPEPEPDFWSKTRTKPEPDYETRQNPKGFMRIKNIDFGQKLLHF